MLFIKSFTSLCALLSTMTLVSAHGNVNGWNVDGQWSEAYLPHRDPYKKPIPHRAMRKVPGNGPVEDITSIDLQCHQGAEPAALIQTIAAGDTIDLHWTPWPNSHKGPVITYLAAAPSDITSWVPGTDAVWFKIDQGGYADGKWAGTDILNSQNSTWPVKIPENLKSGQYLLRHEIVALHSASSYPGAQFYPSCIQLEVTGSGSALPVDGLVALPGAYKAEEWIINIYKPFTEFPIPGPPVWDGVSNTVGGGSGASPPTSVITAPSTAVTTSATPAETSPIETSAPTVSSVPSDAIESTTIFIASSSAPAVPSSAVAASSSTTPVPSSCAIRVKNEGGCIDDYNKCISASQPSPDWTGCAATKDACISGAHYKRTHRSRGLKRKLNIRRRLSGNY